MRNRSQKAELRSQKTADRRQQIGPRSILYSSLCILYSVFCILSFLAPACSGAQERIQLTALSSMERIGQEQKPYGPGKVEIKAAKNEVESFQVVVTAGSEKIKVVGAEISDLAPEGVLRTGQAGAKIGKDNIKLFRAEYVRVRKSTPGAELPPGLYADPLVPFVNPLTGKSIEPLAQSQKRWGEPATTTGYDMYAVPFELFKGQNQPIWVDVYVPKDVPAGIYSGKFTVKAEGNVSAEMPVALTVWDFTLPDGPTHRNHFGSFHNVTRYFDVKPGSEQSRLVGIEMRYCQAMAEHRINPPIPGSLLPAVNDDGSLNVTAEKHRQLTEFINRFHVTDFEVPRAPFFSLPSSTLRPDYKDISEANRKKAQRYYRDFYAYLKKNGWEKRAYLYMWDEPNLRENYEQVLVLGELVHQAVPELRRLVVEQPYPQDASWPDIDPAVDIWCPLWSFIDRKSIGEKIAKGDEVWSYTALVQRAPRYHPEYQKVKDLDPPHWHIDWPLLVYRVPTWINYQYDITGLLYWSTVTRVVDPWGNPAFAHPAHYNGGGYLFYPGVPCGIEGPVACVRIKNLRDGMEDYEYFAILEKLAGKDAVKKIVNTIAPTWWQFSKDPNEILAAREKLAAEIIRLRK